MQPSHQQLLAEIADSIVEYVEPLYSNCFEAMNEQLFGLAEKAKNNKVQSEIFDGMREIRSNRDQLEEGFISALKSSWSQSPNGQYEEPKPLTILIHENTKGELSLIDDQELDKKIAYGTIIQKANDINFNSLFELNQRLSILNSGYKFDDHSNPYGPARLSQAFADSSDHLELPLTHKKLLLKAFGTAVLDELEEIYSQCNQKLIDAGILPDLKYDIKKANPGSALPAAANESAEQAIEDSAEQATSAPVGNISPSGPGPANYSVQQGSSAPELYHSIQEIMASRPAAAHSWQNQPAEIPGEPIQSAPPAPQINNEPLPGSMPANAPVNTFASGAPAFLQSQPATGASSSASAPAVTYYNNSQLVNVISSMQQQQLPEQLVFDPNLIEETKKQLVSGLRNSDDASEDQEISGLDADTIDLIGMLFEFMLNDQDLCPSVKALLSHLHTPFLKVALLDKDFFTQHNHPARQLLNAMAKAGARWVEENDQERGVFPKMKSVVDRVLLEFEINLELFTELHEDFSQYIAQMEKRAEIAEKRASESIKGKEKLRIARDQAIKEINLRSRNQSVPDFVDQFLRQCWLDILVFTLLRKGEQHPLWNEQKTLIEQLIWSTTPKHSEQEQKQVRDKIQDISEIIARGFEQLGGYPGNSKELLRKIASLQDELLSAPPAPAPAPKKDIETAATEPADADPATPTTPVAKTSTAAASTKPENDSVEKPPAKKAPKKFSPELLEAIKELREIPFGTWFEFTTNSQGDTIRGKLSWYSPATSRYMFVNMQGKQIAVRSMLSLANSMRLGDAVVIQDKKKPLVDRAMFAVYELLKVNKPAA